MSLDNRIPISTRLLQYVLYRSLLPVQYRRSVFFNATQKSIEQEHSSTPHNHRVLLLLKEQNASTLAQNLLHMIPSSIHHRNERRDRILQIGHKLRNGRQAGRAECLHGEHYPSHATTIPTFFFRRRLHLLLLRHLRPRERAPHLQEGQEGIHHLLAEPTIKKTVHAHFALASCM